MAQAGNSERGFEPAEPIAVVGMAMRFPGGSIDSKSFWDMLQHGRSAHGPIPKSRFNIDGYYHPDGARTGSVSPNDPPRCSSLLIRLQINIKGSYFLEEDPGYFDAPFFSMTSSEAIGTDGQQRLMLEVAYETLENGRCVHPQRSISSLPYYQPESRCTVLLGAEPASMLAALPRILRVRVGEIHVS
jgi:acyl transferase domain-containing protein